MEGTSSWVVESLRWRGNGEHGKNRELVFVQIVQKVLLLFFYCRTVLEILCTLDCGELGRVPTANAVPRRLTAEQLRPPKAPEMRASGQDITQQQHTTSAQDKESFVTGAAVTDGTLCAIKLAGTPRLSCVTPRELSHLRAGLWGNRFHLTNTGMDMVGQGAINHVKDSLQLQILCHWSFEWGWIMIIRVH